MRSWHDLSCSHGVMYFREQLSRLNVHVELAARINRALEEKSLTDLGKLEQDLVFGDATSKEVISYLSSPAASNLPAEDKVWPCLSPAILSWAADTAMCTLPQQHECNRHELCRLA